MTIPLHVALPIKLQSLLEDDVVIQTKQVLENLKAVLVEAGSDMDKVVKTTIFIASMDDFTTINDIYGFCQSLI